MTGQPQVQGSPSVQALETSVQVGKVSHSLFSLLSFILLPLLLLFFFLSFFDSLPFCFHYLYSFPGNGWELFLTQPLSRVGR